MTCKDIESVAILDDCSYPPHEKCFVNDEWYSLSLEEFTKALNLAHDYIGWWYGSSRCDDWFFPSREKTEPVESPVARMGAKKVLRSYLVEQFPSLCEEYVSTCP